jgi:serine/threonine-protein kinase PknG
MGGCAQPGCTGAIEDGYCDICGMAPPGDGATMVDSSWPHSGSALSGSGEAPMPPSAQSAPSALFTPESEETSDLDIDGRPADGIPKLKVDEEDAAAGVILAAGVVADAERRCALFRRALPSFPGSLELKLRVLDELITLGRFEQVEVGMSEIQRSSPSDLRVTWYQGRAFLAQGRTEEALALYQALADELPDELAPRHALGIACEASGDLERAMGYYEAVCRADASFTSAALRLARCMEQKGDRAGAVASYRRVPSTSSRYAHAQMAVARILLTPPVGQRLSSIDDLAAASAALESLAGPVDGIDAHHLRADLLTSAAHSSALAGAEARAVQILKIPFEEKALRLAAEAEFRLCARQARSEEERALFVDQANTVRPLTWV